MKDIIIRGNEKQGRIRFFGAVTTSLVNDAQKIHQTSPVVSAAFGRTLTATAMMGTMLKGDMESISLQLKGDGPIGSVVTVGNNIGQVRGYVLNNLVDLPLKENGKLNVGGAIGKGYLTVVRDLKMKEPYVGRVELQSGEVADDLTYYFASSEQIPSVVALGVLVDRDYSIACSGGYIIQLMPDATEEDIEKIENNIRDIPSVTNMLKSGMTVDDIIEKVLNGFEICVTERREPEYKCVCNYDSIKRALMSIGREELTDILEKEGFAEMTCYYCNKKYTIDGETIREMLNQ